VKPPVDRFRRKSEEEPPQLPAVGLLKPGESYVTRSRRPYRHHLAHLNTIGLCCVA
jgi:hypothetical protein